MRKVLIRHLVLGLMPTDEKKQGDQQPDDHPLSRIGRVSGPQRPGAEGHVEAQIGRIDHDEVVALEPSHFVRIIVSSSNGGEGERSPGMLTTLYGYVELLYRECRWINRSCVKMSPDRV